MFYSPHQRSIAQLPTRAGVLCSLLLLVACGGGSNSDETVASDNDALANAITVDSDSNNEGVIETVVENTPDPTPMVRAPANAQIVITEALRLAGTVTLETTQSSLPVIQWSQLTGPGNTTFTNPQNATSSATFDEAGTYTLQLSGSNGASQATDTLQVIVTDVITNIAPTVSAGSNENLSIDDVLNLSGEVEDDGLPNNTLITQWSKNSGPGDVTFGEIGSLNTTATFSTSGTYSLGLRADDGELEKSDTIVVTVTAAAPNNNTAGNINAQNQWAKVDTSNGSQPQARHEAAAIAYQGNMYLLGGRGKRQVNRYNPDDNRWENLGTPNLELSHFQPVIHNDKIYVIGSLVGNFPREDVLETIQIFNPANNQWSEGASLPANRQRGSAGTVVYNNKIYMVGGSTNGHDGGMVSWFDEYNPTTNTWKTLPDAPNARDHFSAAVVGNKLVAAGGRQTDHPATFQNLVRKVDVYNFGTGEWSSGASIPTTRAGAMTVSHGDEVILIGGESDTGRPALGVVEAYNVKTNSWRTLDSLPTERHSGGVTIVGGAIHVVSGNTTTGGGSESQAHEKLDLE